jgi:uncharacterized protein (DUF305 family)
MKIVFALATAAGLALASTAMAQMHQHGQGAAAPAAADHSMHGDAHAGHGGTHEGAASPKGDNSPSSVAFNAVNLKMHGAMDIIYTGNADVDFIKGMLPHHQGAVDMAKVVLTYGKDPAVRKLAEAIIKAQNDEIAFMQNWLTANAAPAK